MKLVGAYQIEDMRLFFLGLRSGGGLVSFAWVLLCGLGMGGGGTRDWLCCSLSVIFP